MFIVLGGGARTDRVMTMEQTMHARSQRCWPGATKLGEPDMVLIVDCDVGLVLCRALAIGGWWLKM